MINNVVLTGRLTRDSEQKITQNGKTVALFTLAVDNPTKEPSTSYIPCKAFDNAANAIINYTHKGSLIGLTGSINQRNYQDKDGNTRSIIEVIVNRVELLEPKRLEESQQEVTENTNDSSIPPLPIPNEDDLPF